MNFNLNFEDLNITNYQEFILIMKRNKKNSKLKIYMGLN